MPQPYLCIVDDEASYAEFVSEVARDLGFETAVFSSAREFTAQVTNRTPDLIVMDVVMPDMDGIELVQWLAAHRIGAPVPLISGYEYSDIAQTIGTNQGVNILGSIQKPFPVSELEQHLNTVLETS